MEMEHINNTNQMEQLARVMQIVNDIGRSLDCEIDISTSVYSDGRRVTRLEITDKEGVSA